MTAIAALLTAGCMEDQRREYAKCVLLARQHGPTHERGMSVLVTPEAAPVIEACMVASGYEPSYIAFGCAWAPRSDAMCWKPSGYFGRQIYRLEVIWTCLDRTDAACSGDRRKLALY